MPTLNSEDIDHRLLQVGLLIGLLKKQGDPKLVELDTGWFEHPLDALSHLTADGTEQVIELLEGAFPPDPESSARGGDDWRALTYRDASGQLCPTPLHLVRRSADAPGNDADLLGVGYRPVGTIGAVVRPFLFVPLLAGGKFVAGAADYPIEAGVEIHSSEGFKSKAIGFAGLKLSARLYLSKAPEISDLVVTGLSFAKGVTLPGIKAGQNEVGLLQIVESSAQQPGAWVDFVFSVLSAETAGTDVAVAATALANLRDVLGLGSGGIPSIDYDALLQDPAAALKQWLAGIFYDATSRRAWLGALQRFLHGTPAASASADPLRGEGTTADPFVLSLSTSRAEGGLSCTLAASPAAENRVQLAIGCRVESGSLEVAPGIGVQFSAVVQAGDFSITPKDIVLTGFLRDLELRLGVANPASSDEKPQTLFRSPPSEAGAPGAASTLALGGTNLTLAIDLSGGAPRVQPGWQLTGVEYGPTKFDLDLLTLRQRPAGSPTDEPLTSSQAADLLKALGAALEAAWKAYQPDAALDLESNVERIVHGDRYRDLIAALLPFSRTKSENISDLAQELAGWISQTALEEFPAQATSWLFADGRIFGTLGGWLGHDQPDFRGDDTLLSYTPWPNFAVSIGYKSGQFGFWLRPQVELDCCWVAAEAAAVFSQGINQSPQLTVSGRVGIAEDALFAVREAGCALAPELVVTFVPERTAFSVDFYPFGAGASDAPLIAVVPNPLATPYLAYANQHATPVAARDWMLRVVPEVLTPLFEEEVLNDAGVASLLAQAPLGGEFTPRNVLIDWGLLQPDPVDRTRYQLAPWDEIAALTATGLLKTVALNLQKCGTEILLLEIGKQGDGVYFVAQKSDNGAAAATDFGLRLRIADIALMNPGTPVDADGGPAKQPPAPTATLQLGKWIDPNEPPPHWLAQSGGDNTAEPGVTMTLLRITDGEATFHPSFKLVSVGVDIAGAPDHPLFNLKGYQLRGVQSRLYLAWTQGQSTPDLGAAVRLDDFGLPLELQAGAASSNPVAASLLEGGEDQTASRPANPTFSLLAAYAGKFHGEILSSPPNAGNTVWMPVRKSLGPLYCRNLGLGFDSADLRLQIGYDGSVALGPLGIDLVDLSVGIPLRTPQDTSAYSFELGGLDLTFQGGPVEISGSFLESEVDGVTHYTGAALLKAETFALSGLGSYATIGGDPSLFVFAVLDKDLGGPAFFHVIGLAAGFGFKRRLVLPAIDDVAQFPLVRAATDPNYIGTSADPKEALQKVSAAIPPDPSAYWLAVGVRFRSFEQIDTVALLTVTFGAEFTLSILGLSRLTVPSNLKEGQRPLCYAELALRAEFNPAVGVLAVQGQLTANSYIFDEACKLTGGFAFFTWFSGEHEGDFVVTLGGYHPRFVRPAHYPVVPRVGIAWRVSDNVRITGELYFALTPGCLMAGGKLSAVYDGGWVQAWFTAYADFLISWKPFHYDIAVGVSIGVSATVSVDFGLFSISVSITFELGVDLWLHGPPFAGTARISYWIVSFTISFGPDPTEPKPIAWDEFAGSFLPQPAAVCAVAFTGGLLQQWKPVEGGAAVAIVNGHEFEITVQSKAPCTAIGWVEATDDNAAPRVAGDEERQPTKTTPVEGGDTWQGKLGVTPMYASDLTSVLTVELKGEEGNPMPRDLFILSVVNRGFPAALWDQGKPSFAQPSSKVLPSVPAGLVIGLRERQEPTHIPHSLPAMALEEFRSDRILLQIPWQDAVAPADTIVAPGEHTLANTIWGNAEVTATRQGILAALASTTPYPLNDVALAQTSTSAETIYRSAPTFAQLGELLAGQN